MTGRCTAMDATPAARRRTRLRGLCLAAAMLCALGVLCGVIARANGHAHHGHVSTAAATVADGHSSLGRSDLSAVATATRAAGVVRLVATATVESRSAADQSELQVVRTRGPPAIGA